MVRIAQLFLLALICFSSCKKKPEEVLASIKKHYNEINEEQKDLKSKRVDDITSKSGGTITGYYRDEELKKMVSQQYTDTNRLFSEYYFDDGMLIYILKQNYIYNKPASYTEEWARAAGDSVWYDDKKTRLELSMFFFNKNKMVKWSDPENDIPENSEEFIDKESALWAETVVLIKQLKEQ